MITTDKGIICTRSKYELTVSGKSWKTNPVSVWQEEIGEYQYKNYIDSIPYFNRKTLHEFGLEDKSYCKGYKKHTKYGYITYKIVTISPAGDEKTVVEFKFI